MSREAASKVIELVLIAAVQDEAGSLGCEVCGRCAAEAVGGAVIKMVGVSLMGLVIFPDRVKPRAG